MSAIGKVKKTNAWAKSAGRCAWETRGQVDAWPLHVGGAKSHLSRRFLCLDQQTITDPKINTPSRATSSIDSVGMLNKVPAVTLAFWVIKIMATTVGETAADFLNTNLHFGLTNTSLAIGALLAVALFWQMRARRYIPWIYWVSVVLISVAGTLVTDNITDHFGVPLPATTTLFALALGLTFAIWHASEKTLSIHTITSTKREVYYWLAILFTFALGTAAGDFLAETLQLGYLLSAVLFGAAIGLVTVVHYRLRLNAILAFWLAYILTRPFGASFGDLLSQPAQGGGMGLGTVVTSAGFLIVIAALVAFMSTRERQVDATAIVDARR